MTDPGPMQASGDAGAAANIAETGGHGGRLATLLSGLALIFSGFSFHESALKQADLSVFVAPVIHYARDSGGDIELLAIPITISNEGANTGTVLAMEVTGESLAAASEVKSKTYYSAYVGEHQRDDSAPKKSFAPISVPGRATYTQTILFYPQGNPLPRLIDAAGTYRLTLRLLTAEPPQPGRLDSLFRRPPVAPIRFELQLPYLTEQGLNFRRATIPMHSTDWKPTAVSGR